MIDEKVVAQLIENYIKTTVTSKVIEVMSEPTWLDNIENKIVNHAQERVTAKFANVSSMPEIISAIQTSVEHLFKQGSIPSLETFINAETVRQAVDQAVEKTVDETIQNLTLDPAWVSKIETKINQAMISRVVAGLNNTDVTSIVRDQVDQRLGDVRRQVFPGLNDQATDIELTVLDGVVVAENDFVVKNLEVVRDAVVNNLTVKGSINTDNPSWQALTNEIADKTFNKIDDTWQEDLVTRVSKKIGDQGIEFNEVTIGGEPVIQGNKLTTKVTETNIQRLGTLYDINVKGAASFYDTLHVDNRRVGINTHDPEMALTIWDEEVSLIAGKSAANTAFLGTAKMQSLAFGINRNPQIEIDVDGLTTIRKLKIDKNNISFGVEVPNYKGNKGDIVFNSNFNPSNKIFAWMCLGNFRWYTIRTVE